MLSKPFSKMAPSVWNKAPRSTNGVERANSLAKGGDTRLFCVMQSLYEKDKMFAIAAKGGSKITYRSEAS